MRMGKRETYSDITSLLKETTMHGTHFKWAKECNRSFRRLKDQLSSNTVLMNYVPACPTRVYVDHGPERGGFHHCPGIQQYGEERHAMEASVTYK